MIHNTNRNKTGSLPSRMIHGPAASAAPGNLQEMQNPRSHPSLTVLESALAQACFVLRHPPRVTCPWKSTYSAPTSSFTCEKHSSVEFLSTNDVFELARGKSLCRPCWNRREFTRKSREYSVTIALRLLAAVGGTSPFCGEFLVALCPLPRKYPGVLTPLVSPKVASLEVEPLHT